VAASGTGLRLRQSQRLRQRAEFDCVLASGAVLRGSWFHAHYRPRDGGVARLGLIISKKLAPKAVQRNLLKRLAREAFRQAGERLADHDVVLRLARRPGESKVKEERQRQRAAVRADLERLLRRLPQ